jgi:hypothetical protein
LKGMIWPPDLLQDAILPFRTRARGAHQAAMAPSRAPEWDHAKIHRNNGSAGEVEYLYAATAPPLHAATC